MTRDPLPPLQVLRFIDGKPGHEKQSQALVEGLKHWRSVDERVIDVRELSHTTKALLTGRWPELDVDSQEDSQKCQGLLAMGAGHSTHWPLLASKRSLGAQAVVIMNPSLPLALFDAVITPRHDQFKAGGKRLVSPTALAPTVASHPQKNQGLVLLGGTNKHFEWPEAAILTMLTQITERSPTKRWQISNSRRTPDSTSHRVAEFCHHQPHCQFIDVNHSPAHWLAQQLTTTEEIWITKDSASMLAEALNTRARVGLIDLPNKKPGKDNKMDRATQPLIEANTVGLVTPSSLQSAPRRAEPANHHITTAGDLLNLLKLNP